MKVGQYVRCPIVFEENDNYFPRNFVLGKITSINDLSGEVNVKLYDLKDSKRFYAHAFERGKFAIDKVKRCGAAKDAPVVTPDGRGKILSRRIEQTEDAMYEYYVMLSNGEINSYFEDELEIEYSASDYQPLKQMMQYEFQNPTWYANRLHVSNNMHMVNNTVYGFKELAGCRTYLMAHQISTIVRAFESIFQRRTRQYENHSRSRSRDLRFHRAQNQNFFHRKRLRGIQGRLGIPRWED